jgi:Bacterial SH3 domain
MAHRAMRAEKARDPAPPAGAENAAQGSGEAVDAPLDEQKFASLTGALIARNARPGPFADAVASESAAASPLLARKGEAGPSALEPAPAALPAQDGFLAAVEAEVAARIAEFRDFWQHETDAIVAEVEAEAEQRHREAQQASHREHREALAHAEEAFKRGEADRRANLEAGWQAALSNALAELRATHAADDERRAGELRWMSAALVDSEARLKERDALLAKAETERSAAESARAAAVAERDGALARARAEIDTVREQSRTEMREDCAVGLAEATARYDAAELALEELQTRSEAAQERAQEEIRALREELANLRTMFAAQELQLEDARAVLGEAGSGAPDGKLVLRPDRVWRRSGKRNRGMPQKLRRSILRDAAIAATIAASIVLFFPYAGAILPGNWRAQPEAAMGRLEAAQAEEPATPRLAGARKAPALLTASLVHGANFRVGPSGQAEVIATLPRGTEVAALEQRGDWARVRVLGDGKAAPREGWVYAPFLKPAPQRSMP